MTRTRGAYVTTRPRGLRVVLVAGALGVLAAACTYLARPSNEPYRPPGVTAPVTSTNAGAQLFDRDCAWCHGPSGQGTRYGPNLNGPLDGGAYTDFMLRTGRMPLPDPTARAARGPVRYSSRQIAQIVAYVETFGGSGPGIPAVSVRSGDLAAGAALYLDNCAACHSTTGVGGALTSGQTVPDLHRATPTEVAEAMLVGPGCPNTSRACGPGEGAMPRFAFDASEVNAIARYVRYLQAPNDEGGAPILRIGPVAEGAVGLLLGLGALLLVVRWIGTKVADER